MFREDPCSVVFREKVLQCENSRIGDPCLKWKRDRKISSAHTESSACQTGGIMFSYRGMVRMNENGCHSSK